MESSGADKGQPAPSVERSESVDTTPKFRALFAYAGQHEDELSFQVRAGSCPSLWNNILPLRVPCLSKSSLSIGDWRLCTSGHRGLLILCVTGLLFLGFCQFSNRRLWPKLTHHFKSFGFGSVDRSVCLSQHVLLPTAEKTKIKQKPGMAHLKR